jgi:hypothetical protein
MRRRLPALLLLPLLLLGCQRTRVVVGEKQRAACRLEAEKAASPQEALERNASCLARAIEAPESPASESPALPAPQTAAPLAAPIDRYSYCRIHEDEVRAASARLTRAAKPWILAPKRFSPDSREYQAARREYRAAVAELERLLPPEIRNGMDLLPTATNAFSHCDRQELEGGAGQAPT